MSHVFGVSEVGDLEHMQALGAWGKSQRTASGPPAPAKEGVADSGDNNPLPRGLPPISQSYKVLSHLPSYLMLTITLRGEDRDYYLRFTDEETEASVGEGVPLCLCLLPHMSSLPHSGLWEKKFQF